MKITLAIVFVALCSALWAQNLDSLGANDNSLLNSVEANYLNQSVGVQRGAFDFMGKRVVFAEGNNARLITKSDYFKRHVMPRLAAGGFMANYLVVLTDEEKKDSGGFDAIIVAWSKIGLTTRRKKRIIKEMQKTAAHIRS